MFCPLCKAEFRDGFTHCSDCHIPLVATKQEADQQTVTQVWRGGSKSEFESILSALQRAEIPLMFRERSNVRSVVRSTFVGFLSRRHRPNYDTEFEVDVLGSDANRARQAIRHAAWERARQVVRQLRRIGN